MVQKAKFKLKKMGIPKGTSPLRTPLYFVKIYLLAFSMFFCHQAYSLRAGYFEPWGKDAALKEVKPEKTSIYDVPQTRNVLVKGMEKLVNFHQTVISPVDGPRSHFRPTSSRYMLLAMKRHGFIKGFIMGCDRLMRENNDPWVYRKREIDGKVYKWDPTVKSVTAPKKEKPNSSIK